jgi:hypothetical protein
MNNCTQQMSLASWYMYHTFTCKLCFLFFICECLVHLQYSYNSSHFKTRENYSTTNVHHMKKEVCSIQRTVFWSFTLCRFVA